MSDDWDSVTRIGKGVRGGNQRPTVARTQAEVNAARRAGAVVATDKKVFFSSFPPPKARADMRNSTQRATKCSRRTASG